MFVLFNYYITMEKLNTLLQDYKNWLLNEHDLKEYESDLKSFKELVQRLVDNDKIDKKKIDKAERRPMYVTDDMFALYNLDECVLMLLSIQDNPLEYLCSILK